MEPYRVENAYYDSVEPIKFNPEYVLSDLDKLCFKCELPDCKPGKNCIIEITKKNKNGT